MAAPGVGGVDCDGETISTCSDSEDQQRPTAPTRRAHVVYTPSARHASRARGRALTQVLAWARGCIVSTSPLLNYRFAVKRCASVVNRACAAVKSGRSTPPVGWRRSSARVGTMQTRRAAHT